VLGVKSSQHNTTEDVECITVGGYRRGKLECGDVDVVLSHRDENKTKDLVVDVVRSLEGEGWITHTLTLNTTTSDRGQATLPYHGSHRGHGFDSLDKALCVWQDPHFDPPTPLEGGGNVNLNVKNPNVHRRVDIIISSWRTVGCAVLGWSGGTTFQRDIRQFVAKTRGLKFDSSGVRDRSNGLVLDFEAGRPKTKEALEAVFKGKPPVAMPGDDWDDKDTWQDRERRLMDGLGFGYRPPHERCTG
jgi:DNA polymerase IV